MSPNSRIARQPPSASTHSRSASITTSPTLTTRVVQRKARSPNLRRRVSGAVGASACGGTPIVAICARYPVGLVGVTGVPFTLIFETSFNASFAKSLGSGA